MISQLSAFSTNVTGVLGAAPGRLWWYYLLDAGRYGLVGNYPSI